MAKEDNNQPKEVADEIEQPKEKKTKDKKDKPAKTKSDGPSMILMIGGAVAAVILIIASVIIGTVVANKLFSPVQNAVVAANTEVDSSKVKEELPPMPDEEEGEDVISLLADSDWFTLTTARMQTNLASPQSTILLIELAINYKPYYVEQLTKKGFLKSEGEDANGKPIMIVDTTNDIYKKLNQMISSKMLEYISSHDQMAIQQLRYNTELSDTLKTVLKPIFRSAGLTIGNVDIPYFMFART